MRKPQVARILLTVFIISPLIAWFVVKPVRVIAPTLVGMVCPNERVCIEANENPEEANALYSEAVSFVNKNVGSISGVPKVVFCKTEACSNSFGLGKRSAVTIGTMGTVIAPRAWKPYYVRHELIHYLQGERIGVLRRMFKPSWLIEGMAYSLSQDPRDSLESPWQEYRLQFNRWLSEVGTEKMWQEAEKL
jgi:hypothetical protein